MSAKRKCHPAEFKARVAIEAVKGLKTTTELAREFKIHFYQPSFTAFDSQLKVKPIRVIPQYLQGAGQCCLFITNLSLGLAGSTAFNHGSIFSYGIPITLSLTPISKSKKLRMKRWQSI
jgi:hypothetical protein